MSEENKQQTSRPHVDIKKRVSEVLGQAGQRVQEAVINTLADAQIQRRTSAILKAVEKLETADRELQKMSREGNQVFDHEGKPVGTPTFSKDQTENMKRKREEIARMESALTKALGDNPDFQKLFELVGENK